MDENRTNLASIEVLDDLVFTDEMIAIVHTVLPPMKMEITRDREPSGVSCSA